MKFKSSALLLVLSCVSFSFRPKQDQNENALRRFYQLANASQASRAASISKGIFADDYKSCGNNEEVEPGGSAALIKFFGELFKTVPDLTWTIKEIIKSGNRYTVRSEAIGTPVGTFQGVAATGKKFKIMAVDIHTVVNGKIMRTYHVEDWATAIKQLSAK